MDPATEGFDVSRHGPALSWSGGPDETGETFCEACGEEYGHTAACSWAKGDARSRALLPEHAKP